MNHRPLGYEPRPGLQTIQSSRPRRCHVTALGRSPPTRTDRVVPASRTVPAQPPPQGRQTPLAIARVETAGRLPAEDGCHMVKRTKPESRATQGPRVVPLLELQKDLGLTPFPMPLCGGPRQGPGAPPNEGGDRGRRGEEGRRGSGHEVAEAFKDPEIPLRAHDDVARGASPGHAGGRCAACRRLRSRRRG